jgi:uncharacterized protein YqhQ
MSRPSPAALAPNSAPLGTPARPYIGGQAVLEGVMMRAPTSFAVAVRRGDGSILVRERAMRSERTTFGRIPFVRGLVSLVESLRLGGEALRFSVDQLERDLLAQERQAREGRQTPPRAPMAAMLALGAHSVVRALGLSLFAMATNDDPNATIAPSVDGDASEKKRGPMGIMLVVAIAFLIALPQGAAAGLNRLLHLGLDVQSPAFQAITGAFKLTIVIGYLLLIRRVPDIRRVFQYHGAEHKTISTYEAGEALTVDNARAKTTLHPRCGTTFLVMVALVSILIFTGIGAFLPRIHTGSALADNLVFFLEKLPFLPAITGLTFELQRVFARYCTTGPLRVLLWPGFLVQKITTIEPDDAQLEIALASLRATLFREEGRESAEVAGDVAFPSYAAIASAPSLRAAA